MKKLFVLFLIFALAALYLNTFAQTTQPGFQVKTVGKGKQAVILIPGFTCSGDVFDGTAAGLGNQYTSYILTMPGYAGAPAEAAPNINNWVEEIAAYVRKNKLDHPILIGHSLGGGLVMTLTARYPDLFSKAVIVDALPCLGALMNPEFKQAETPDCSAFANRIMPMNDSAMYKMQKVTIPRLTTDTVHREQIIMWGVKTDRKTYVDTYCQFSNLDQRATISAVKIPTLVLLESSFINFKPAIEEQYKNLTTATLKYATKGLHFIMYDDTEWYLNQITQFLQ
ncbi:alpha/beta fold hydrolase [Chitinophaga sp. sic0106]|uniref:alpha/beta fold hydrolase n=1 Tax=Chitinophaga sp. sic0106 TaxID=2854785 RepID=UPI001C47954D|nr:alpha/beta hydrolase [Chitinophaga sp. sic0106]MBV7532353.1 alpha/beta hydrolase [Chitinophaga sp. sic0106]